MAVRERRFIGRLSRGRDTRRWHPFADMSQVCGHELVIERGEGIWLLTDKGDRLLDACASRWYASLGHGRRENAAVVADQFERLEAYSTFADLATPLARELADRLAALAHDGGRAGVRHHRRGRSDQHRGEERAAPTGTSPASRAASI